MTATKYDVPESCNKCGGRTNKLMNEVFDSCMHECETKCQECGFEDYWVTGFFQSGSEIDSKSDQYWFVDGKIHTGKR